MATSLGAIGITALAGTIRYAFHGDVESGATRRSSGCPPRVGAIGGTALQQRLATRVALARSSRLSSSSSACCCSSMTTIVLALVLGLGAGVLAGLFGVGGGILFVPALLALGLSQLHAEATSLLAILPTVVAGSGASSATATSAGGPRS